jgi:DNA-binding MarR family transcriptional regulator
VGIEKDIRAKNFTSHFQKAMVNLSYTYKWWSQQTDEIFKAYDLQSQHFNILRILYGNNKKAKTVKEIKEVIIDKGSDITRLTDKLVNMGLVERQLNPENRREMLVNITNKGVTLSEMIVKKLTSLTQQLNNLTEKEAIELNRLLDKIRER